MSLFQKSIGENIKSIRIKRGITQAELAERLYVTRQTVSNYETGRSNPDVEMLLKIAEQLDTELGSLLYGEESLKRRNSKRGFYLSLAVWLAVSALALILTAEAKTAAMQSYVPSGLALCKLLLYPTAMLSLGWLLVEALDCFVGLKKISHRAQKTGFLLTACILLINLIVIMPDIIYCMSSFLGDAALIKLPGLLSALELFFLRLANAYPYVYILFGMALRLFCKNGRKEAE